MSANNPIHIVVIKGVSIYEQAEAKYQSSLELLVRQLPGLPDLFSHSWYATTYINAQIQNIIHN